MTWTYNAAELANSKLMQVRRLIGDVLPKDQLMQDEEIAFFITQRASTYGAAADCCLALAAQFSRLVDSADQTTRIMYSTKASRYRTMAATFNAKATVGAVPYAGGISVTDKQSQESDADRVTPAFNVGMTDNYLPVPDAGNEPGSAASGGGNDAK